MTDRPKPIRCAVYTRKSTEHNLDLEFNSLHAQREACESYIKSQFHEGWQLIPDQYDDGAFSGASLDRPDIQRLLADIAAGKIDNVVVYKVDRLTRSLTDFAKLIELFDKHNVSFVSVTQAFNTTTSMGRLTLNVLLSFAQFEREVIGERVRDKIAASKRKGLFMGGTIPLGYSNQGKRLVIVPAEAECVRWIFSRYLKLKSIGLLLEEMRRCDLRTKAITLADGKTRGGGYFGKGSLAYLLKNRCYAGQVVHQGLVHAGDHAPLIDSVTFEAVQELLATNSVARVARLKASPYFLTGLLFDAGGNCMSPTHTNKKGVRYRYYVSQARLQGLGADARWVGRVPAPDIEALVQAFLVERHGHLPPGDVRSTLEMHVRKITVEAQGVKVELHDGGEAEESQQSFSLPWRAKPSLAVKGVSTERPIQDWEAPKRRDAIFSAIVKSRGWIEELMNGGEVADIAKREGKGERQIRLLLPLAFLSPQTVRKVTDKSWTPVTVTELARGVPLVWPTEDVSEPQ